ncbi:MAG: tetratricopeptide repeat protein [Deltaproteobacteria bacterium]|nr:tetratricopeptide repeat protein [Deltaproteobacteria bacterium]
MTFHVKTELKKALEYHRSGQLQKAEEIYRMILETNPDHSDSLHSLGVIANQVGNNNMAVKLIGKAIEINSKEPIYYNNIGNAFKAQGNLKQAVSSYQKALLLKPDFAEALVSMGSAYNELGRSDEAISCFTKALQFNQNFADAYYNMAIAFKKQNKINEAIVYYKKSLNLNPGLADAYYNLGAIYMQNCNFEESAFCYQKVLDIKPANADAYYNLGIVCQEQGKLNEAVAYYQKAVLLEPSHGKAYNNMGTSLKEQGRLEESILCYKESLKIIPNAGIEVKMALMFPLIFESIELIKSEREKLSDRIELLINNNITLGDPAKEVGTTSFYLAYHGLKNKGLQEKLAGLFLHACPDLAWVSPNCRKYTGGKIRIGIVSRFFYEHTIGLLNQGIIENLSREKFQVKIFRFQGKEDALTKSLDGAADEAVILPNEMAAARSIIAEHSLDILFYPDIGMDPLTYFISFSRLAPIQCTTWGHPVTTGIPNMDYYISSENAEPPDANDHYSETLVLLKRFVMYCLRPQMPENPVSRKQFDLPEDCNLYVCPQTLFKFHPDFDEVLGSILRRDPHGLLILFETRQGRLAKLVKNRFMHTFPDVFDRVRFMPRMPKNKYFSFLQVADILLDTPHFTGGYTSLLAFAFGIPIITWPGRFMCGRLTLGLYKQIGVMDCVADDAQSYADIAYRLANDKTFKDEIKSKILKNADILYEDMETVRELERFFERVVKK